MTGFGARDVAKLLDLSVGQVRAFVRAGFLTPERGARGEYRFTFQDLVLLRTAKGLVQARIPERRVRAALKSLKRQLPADRPLSGVQIAAEGARIVVRDGDALWNPESGQVLFDFDVAELEAQVAPLVKAPELQVDDWVATGADLEATQPAEAQAAYARALELDPSCVEARVNLGRLFHRAGELVVAESHYRIATEVAPDDPTAQFNLGVVLEDLGRLEEAVSAYDAAIAADPRYRDAYYNLAHLYETLGRPTLALRCLRTYRRLTE